MKKNLRLWSIINNANSTQRANETFAADSNLEFLAGNFVNFITPHLYVDGQSLAEVTLVKAFQSFAEADARYKSRAFVEALAESVDTLTKVRVSVQDCDGLWMIWAYNEPLQELLDRHKTKVLQIKPRDNAVGRTPVLVKLLAAIATAEYMVHANLDFHRIFFAEAAAA